MAGTMHRVKFGAAGLVVSVFVMAGCASTSASTGAGTTKRIDNTGQVTQPSSVPQISVGDSELSYDAAISAGAVRNDAVLVLGETDVSTGGREVAYPVTVQTARPRPAATVDVAVSGTCITRTLGQATPAHALRVVTNGRNGQVDIKVSIPSGRSTCYVVIDAWIRGNTYTGNSLTANFRH